MKNRLLYWAITCALAGFIFGFDLIVISGAEQRIQDLWGLTGVQHGLAMSSALWGTVMGAVFGALPTNRFGRKQTLLWIGIFYFVSAVGSALADSVTSFSLFRLIGGIGIGVSTVAAPLFISEISPADRRGRLTGMFQFNIVLGLLVATLSNALLGSLLGTESETAWRWMLGIEALPALIYSVMCFSLPESPRWLINQGRQAEAKTILSEINPSMSDQDLESQVSEIEAASTSQKTNPSSYSKHLKVAVTLAFLIAFFNQLSGINAILGFAPRILGMTGLDPSTSLLNASLITLVNLIFTLVGLRLIDKLGRRTLLYIGSVGYILSLAICAWAFNAYKAPFESAADALELKKNAVAITENPKELPQRYVEEVSLENLDEKTLSSLAEASLEKAKEESGAGSLLVLFCILGFIAAHAVGQGAVIWVFISEIFPATSRGFGQALGSGTHWVFAAILTFAFPIAMESFSATTIFGFFAFMMVLQLIWVHLKVPETKGVSLENIEKELTR